jgi:hypothetical protein
VLPCTEVIVRATRKIFPLAGTENSTNAAFIVNSDNYFAIFSNHALEHGIIFDFS